MVMKQTSAATSVPREEKRAVEGRSGLTRLLVVTIGMLLLTLAAGSALADSVRVGGTEAQRGTEGDDRLAGSAKDDVIWARDGDDELYGDRGRDLIFGGAGDDFVEAKDGEADVIGCGAGDDVASVDRFDRVEGDCEALYPG